jgi:ferrochelatase
MAAPAYDAFLLLSFGGPEKRDDVIPFLENVLRGKNVPRERLLEVAEHYYHFGGRSPINDHNRALLEALRQEFSTHGLQLPIYWGNRNWHPLLADTLRQMQRDGVRHALAFATSAFSSYSGCRQYREDIERARAEAGPGAPQVTKLRVFFNHPGFLAAMISRTRDALASLPSGSPATPVLFTAHSVPLAMAQGPNAHYVPQLEETCRLIAEQLNLTNWSLVYQSRSGPPGQPWLEPDVSDAIRQLAAQGASELVIVPVGFVSDHMEVLYDLDTEARQLCDQLNLRMARASTAGLHPEFVSMIRQLAAERLHAAPRLSLGALGPYPDVCPPDCCPAPHRPARPAPASSR